MPKLRTRPVSQKEQATLDQLSSLSLADLYAQFGQQLGTLAPGITAEAQAQGWIASRKDELQKVICIKGQYCSFVAKNRNAKAIEIIAALSDLLASAFSGVPIYTLASLLVRIGLDGFCQCESLKAS